MLLGELGSGKSSAFSYLYREYLKDNYFILGHSTQMGDGEVDERIILYRWIYELANELGIEYPFEEDLEAIEEQEIHGIFGDFLEKISFQRKVLIIFDNAHLLPNNKNKNFLWLKKVPFNVKLCFTSNNNNPPQLLLDEMTIYSLKLFSEKEARSLLDLLCKRHSKVLNYTLINQIFNIRRKDLEKEIYDIQREKVEVEKHDWYHPTVKSFVEQLEPPLHAFAYGNPLWLQHVYDELYYINEFDLREIYKINGLEHEKLNHVLSQRIEGISSDFRGMANQLLKRAESIFGVETIKLFTLLIATTRYGINENSIIYLINNISTSCNMNNLNFARIIRFFRPYLMAWGEDERFRFSYQHIKAAVIKRYLSQVDLNSIDFEIRFLEIQTSYFKNLSTDKEEYFQELDWFENILGERYLKAILALEDTDDFDNILAIWGKYVSLTETKVNTDINDKSINSAIQILNYFQENINPLDLRFMVQFVPPRKHKDFIQDIFTNNLTDTKKRYIPFKIKDLEVAFTLGRYIVESKLDYCVKNLFIRFINKKGINQEQNKGKIEQIILLMTLREAWHRYID
ncbi:hypothetical protein [Priestia aryabhattai]